MKDLSWLLTVPVAHRGYHPPGIPENSMAAFRAALENGWNMEMDLHRTRDDVLVVFHDDNLSRMTSYDKNIEDCTFAEVRNLVLDRTGERIPALAEVLEYVHGRAGLFIEVKTHPDIGRTEELCARLLDTYAGKFAVLSFDPRVLRWFCHNRPHYIRGQISGSLRGKDLPWLRRFCVKNLLVTFISRPDFIAYESGYLSSWIRFLAWILRAPIVVWTIRDPAAAGRAGEAGYNIIFEGFPYKKSSKKQE